MSHYFIGRPARQSQILHAARALLLEGGPSAVTIASLGERSASSVGSVYHHFGNKEGVLDAVRDDVLMRYRSVLHDALRLDDAPPKDIKRVIKTLVRLHFDHVYKTPDDAQILAANTPLEEMVPHPFLRDVLRRAALEQQIEDVPYAMVPALILGPVRAMVNTLHTKDSDEAKVFRDIFARTAWRTLRKR